MGRLTAEQRRILKPALAKVDAADRSQLERAVEAAGEAAGSYLLAEMVQGVSKRERRAWGLATSGLLLGTLGLATGAYGLLTNETEAYLALVDRDTGVVERAVSVERASVTQRAAVVESLIYSYVLDRETYDTDDNEYRILSVFSRSAQTVRNVLETQWTRGAYNYPPELYGPDGKVLVSISNVVMIDEDTAQVRFTKTFTGFNSQTERGEFVATVTYAFNPATVDNNLLLWQNPFGFQVVGYRVNSEGNSE